MNSWMVRKIALMCVLVMLPYWAYAADTCYAIDGQSVFSNARAPWPSSKGSYNYSDMFMSGSTSASFVYRAQFNGYGWCEKIGSNPIYYINPLSLANSGLYLHFIDKTSGVDEWVLVESQLLNSSGTVSTLAGSFSINSSVANVNYRLTFRYLGKLPIAPSYSLETSNNKLVIPTVMLASEQHGSLDAYQSWSTGNWGTKKWLAYEELTVVYQPTATTCNVPGQTITLDRTSIESIRNGTSPKTPFVLSFNCRGGANHTALNDINAWLYSGDIVNDNQTVLRSTTSSSTGVGINLLNASGHPIKLSNSRTAVNDADLVLDIDEDDIFSDVEQVSIYAAYAIYDAKPQQGSVEATATVMINYD